jgi:segregation and condensation protein A
MTALPEAPIDFANLFEVNLELFEGPIDLLLHLVKREELPIEKVSLAQVTTQYLSCIERIRHFDFDLAGEYLVMAATLLAIKSSVLLNEPVDPVVDNQGNEVDPTEELLARMKEMEIVQARALSLAGRAMLGVDVFEPAPSTGAVVTEFRLKDHDPLWLGQAFRRLLEKGGEKRDFVIMIDPVSIADRMVRIVDLLRDREVPIRFEEVVGDGNLSSVIASFIALLELCKRLLIVVRQDAVFDEIFIELAKGDPSLAEGNPAGDATGAEVVIAVDEYAGGLVAEG